MPMHVLGLTNPKTVEAGIGQDLLKRLGSCHQAFIKLYLAANMGEVV